MRAADGMDAASSRRQRTRFGLDTVLPADPEAIEADVLRLLAADAPEVLTVRPSGQPDRAPVPGRRAVPPFARGVPDLVLLAPGGRVACLTFRTQAARPTRDQAAFADLCRQRGVPFAAVRSLAEARTVLGRLGLIAVAD